MTVLPIELSAIRAFELWHSPTVLIHCEGFKKLNPEALIAAATEAHRQAQLRRAEYYQRKALRPPTHLTLLADLSAKSGTKTHITCSSDPLRRIKTLYQNPDKKQLQPIITLSSFNHHNNLSASAIKHVWKKTYRDIRGRVSGGLQLAKTYHLDVLDHQGGTYLEDLMHEADATAPATKTRKLPFDRSQVLRDSTTMRPRRRRKAGTFGSAAYLAHVQSTSS